MAPTPEPVPTQVYEGQGNDVVDLTTPVQVGILIFECPQCRGGTEVKSNAGIDEGLVNRFSGGPYTGKQWLGMRGGTTSRLQVKADGKWKATIGGLELATRSSGSVPVAGSSDDVILLETAPDTVTITNKGGNNFTVLLMTDRFTTGPELLVNEIGNYQGNVLFDVNGTDAGLVQIESDGEWSLTPKP